MTMTAIRPSELPRVEIVATMGLSSQMAANPLALAALMPLWLRLMVKTLTTSHPASTSATANSTLPKEK